MCCGRVIKIRLIDVDRNNRIISVQFIVSISDTASIVLVQRLLLCTGCISAVKSRTMDKIHTGLETAGEQLLLAISQSTDLAELATSYLNGATRETSCQFYRRTTCDNFPPINLPLCTIYSRRRVQTAPRLSIGLGFATPRHKRI